MSDRNRNAARISAIIVGSVAVFISIGVTCAQASSLRVSAAATQRIANEQEADYTTSHISLDEVAGDSVPITVFFDPQTLGVQSAEIYTNLNRRDRAVSKPAGAAVEEGIEPPSGNSIAAGDDSHYYKAYPMQLVAGGYQVTLPVTKCGVYRLTARYRLNGDPAGTYRWYGDEQNAQGTPKRDHAIVVSPSDVRNLQIYEVNPLTITATGTNPSQRGTFSSLAAGDGMAGGPAFSLDYVKALGVNTLWLQPIHPRAIANRQIDPATGQPFELGSPYAVKNFFSVMPLLAAGFTPGATPAANDTPAGRATALSEFSGFVRTADSNGINVFLDAPFNHMGWDAELSSFGVPYWGASGANPTAEIRSVEARVFSRAGEYDMRAFSADSIAQAPDRIDFGKFTDVADIYFGRYSALVPNQSQPQNYRNEGDWFDFSIGNESNTGSGNGHFDRITQSVWRYFGDYLQFWLTTTGYPANAVGAALDSQAGIDGLRADFAQGLPPQAWDYIINRTRARKWNFVFMAESLDGGPVSYRSARDFDVLNDSLIYDLRGASRTTDFRAIFDQRRSSYGGTPVLLNTTSQDEDNYRDPYEAFLRFEVNSTIDGVPMVFPGQELGLKGTVSSPGQQAAGPVTPFGYDRYENESAFGSKPVPEFKTFNSLMPLWHQLANGQPDAVHLLALYSAVGHARQTSAALRSANRYYLNTMNGTPNQQIFSVAKVERFNGNPKVSDVVFAFVNLATGSNVGTAPGAAFNVNVDADNDGVNDFGIQPNALYNVKDIAAYTGSDPNRAGRWLWPKSRLGSDLLRNGVGVFMNKIPANAAGWAKAPYEAQYLKLFDVTPVALGARVPVLTRSYDNNRSGANTHESTLTPAAVAAHGMTKLFTLQLTGDDPRIEAQPLYVPDIVMNDGQKHDVVYVFSMSNHVWAFDANTGAQIWAHPVSLGPPFLAQPGDPVDSYGINKSFGILSTPVIDAAAQTMYIANWIVDGAGNRQLHLNALRLSDGSTPPGKAPLPMAASIPNAAGKTISLSQVQKQRAALLLTPLDGTATPPNHKLVYVAFTGQDTPPPPTAPDPAAAHHGWILAFDVDAWKQAGAWDATPSSFGGGIWQASQGPAADDEGNVYALTSNGGFLDLPGGQSKDFNGSTDFAETFVKLTAATSGTPNLQLVDWFAPFRDSPRKFWRASDVAPFPQGLDYDDQDLGSSGPLLVPGTNLLLGAGKDGVLYVLDRTNLGKSFGDLSKLKVPPSFFTFDPDPHVPAYAGATPTGDLDFKPMPGVKTHHLHGSPVYWLSSTHGGMVYAWGENGQLRAFALAASGRTQLLAHGAEVASAALASPTSNTLGGMPGGMLALSANGGSDGIIWATAPIDGDANKQVVPGIVRAYDAAAFNTERNADGTPRMRLLWQQTGFDFSKFCPPVVNGGKVFVPTYDGRIDVFGLGG